MAFIMKCQKHKRTLLYNEFLVLTCFEHMLIIIHVAKRAMSVKRTNIYWCDTRSIVSHPNHLVSTSDFVECPPHLTTRTTSRFYSQQLEVYPIW